MTRNYSCFMFIFHRLYNRLQYENESSTTTCNDKVTFHKNDAIKILEMDIEISFQTAGDTDRYAFTTF